MKAVAVKVKVVSVKSLLEATALSGLITLLALARIAYVQHYEVPSRAATIEEALDPVNALAVVSFFGFGIATIILLCACTINAGIFFNGGRRLFRRK
jgi:hypothetical protein